MNFNEFLKKEGLNENFIYIKDRKWLLAEQKNVKTTAVIDKLSADELPNCDDIEHSKVGDFLSAEQFEDLYGDEKENILSNLEDGYMLAYCSATGVTSWWKRRKKGGDDGLVRIQ